MLAHTFGLGQHHQSTFLLLGKPQGHRHATDDSTLVSRLFAENRNKRPIGPRVRALAETVHPVRFSRPKC
jgi:hypothetical protein